MLSCLHLYPNGYKLRSMTTQLVLLLSLRYFRYVVKNGAYFIWVARRSKSKQTYPDMLDNFAAGGLTAGLSVVECALKVFINFIY